MNSEKESEPSGVKGVLNENSEPDLEEWVPLSIREARRRRNELCVWMNFVSMTLLFAAAMIMAYRMGAQRCH